MADAATCGVERLDQAIFTSARGRVRCGYHLVAQSRGVTDEEARDLVAWCPSHDSLAIDAPGGSSLNSHPLSSGRWCLSRTRIGGDEYSGRGPQLVTHAWLADASILSRCGDHPLALERVLARRGIAAPASEQTAGRESPQELEQLAWEGGCRGVEEVTLAEAVQNWGASRLATTLDVAMQRTLVGFVTTRRELLAAALLYCLPREQRRHYSFTTGLVMSPRRPFRWHFFQPGRDSTGLVRRFPRDGLYDVDSAILPAPREGSWAERVSVGLRPGRLLSFARELDRRYLAPTSWRNSSNR